MSDRAASQTIALVLLSGALATSGALCVARIEAGDMRNGVLVLNWFLWVLFVTIYPVSVLPRQVQRHAANLREPSEQKSGEIMEGAGRDEHLLAFRPVAGDEFDMDILAPVIPLHARMLVAALSSRRQLRH